MLLETIDEEIDLKQEQHLGMKPVLFLKDLRVSPSLKFASAFAFTSLIRPPIIVLNLSSLKLLSCFTIVSSLISIERIFSFFN